MDKYEVLVHIAAPSGFREDQRHHAQAKAIAGFEPATIRCIYDGCEEESDRIDQEPETDETAATFVKSLTGEIDIVKETPVPPRFGRLLSKVGSLPASSAPQTSSPARWQITKSTIARKQWPRRDPNPPYKNPLLNRGYQQSTIQAARTPDTSRPQTAPAGGTGSPTNNPFTGWPTRKRARSESSSFESTTSVVQETQQAYQTKPAFTSSGSSTQYLSSSSPGDVRAAAVMKHAQEVDDKEPLLPKKPRLEEPSSSDAGDVRAATVMKHTQEVDDKEPAPPKKPRLEEPLTANTDATINPPGAPSGDQPQPFFLRDRSLDWTSSPSISSPDTTKSTTTPTATATATATASPSQPLPDMARQSLSQSAPEVQEVYRYQNWTSPINLISQDLRSTPPARLPPHISPPAQPSSPPAPPASQPVPTSTTPNPSISSLPDHIFPPDPRTGHGAYITHITPVLAATITHLPIAKRFRPVHVSRDIGVLERGHWRIPITIASQAVVDEARAELSDAQKMAKYRKDRDAPMSMERWEKHLALEAARNQRRDRGLSSSPLEYGEDGGFVERTRRDFWTEEEFVRFWRTLEECVGKGKWGWGIRVFREELVDDETRLPEDAAPSPSASSHAGEATTDTAVEKERRVLLKVTTWGEVVAHIWIMLWLMSDKLTAYVPMEWRAGDGSVVVRMSGYRRRHGMLRDWVYKGPAGEGGVWGVAEAEQEPEARAWAGGAGEVPLEP